MTVKTGLAALREYQDEQKRRAAERDRPKADWMIWTSHGEKGKGSSVDTVIARFLNDWNEDTPLFKANGAPILAVEHQAPGDKGFQRRALCTLDTEGQCFACERHALRLEEDKGGWKQRTNFYINALVDFGDVQKVVIMSRNANASFVSDLLQELEDEGDISEANYRVKVTGDKTTTKWGLKRQKEAFDVDGVVAYNLEEMALRAIPYDKQFEYYSAVYPIVGATDSGSSESITSQSAAAADADW